MAACRASFWGNLGGQRHTTTGHGKGGTTHDLAWYEPCPCHTTMHGLCCQALNCVTGALNDRNEVGNTIATNAFTSNIDEIRRMLTDEREGRPVRGVVPRAAIWGGMTPAPMIVDT